MKVIVADKISERGVELLKKSGLNTVLTTKETITAELADADALIVRSATRVTAELLDKAPKLRAVGRAGVGVDNIDLPEATKRGVLVMSTPGGNAVSVAEHTFALMLALARQVPKVDAALREGRWEKSSSGTELRGKTLGLIGLGRIGGEVARRAEAFDMKVIAYDPYISEAAAKELQVGLVTLDKLLAESDFISMHSALSPATQKMINAESIQKMKKTARIVNAARGELIDEAALAEALKSGRLAGAALDVFVEEPPKNSAVDRLAERNLHSAHRRLDRGSAGRSRHASCSSDSRLSERRNYSQCREFAGAFRGSISSRAPVSGIGGASWLAGLPGNRYASGEDSHSLCG